MNSLKEIKYIAPLNNPTLILMGVCKLYLMSKYLFIIIAYTMLSLLVSQDEHED